MFHDRTVLKKEKHVLYCNREGPGNFGVSEGINHRNLNQTSERCEAS